MPDELGLGYSIGFGVYESDGRIGVVLGSGNGDDHRSITRLHTTWVAIHVYKAVAGYAMR